MSHDRAGRTPLHYAASDEGPVERLERLLAAGGDPNEADKAGRTPLHFAAQQYRLEAAQALLDAGAEVNAEDKEGSTPLHLAVAFSGGRLDMIMLLRSRGADPDSGTKSGGMSPVQLARVLRTSQFDLDAAFADLPEDKT